MGVRELKLVCDEMLQGLGRWLRAAGYDTKIATNGEDDRELLQQAQHEGRLFLTRDRTLLSEHGGYAEGVVLLMSNEVSDCAAELTRRLGIDWLKAPFTRCLLCNRPLVTLTREGQPQMEEPVPDDVWQRGPVLYCEACRKAYWEGSHVRRMRAKLEAFALQQWR
jgi:uncharacterized protein with PIN domain